MKESWQFVWNCFLVGVTVVRWLRASVLHGGFILGFGRMSVRRRVSNRFRRGRRKGAGQVAALIRRRGRGDDRSTGYAPERERRSLRAVCTGGAESGGADSLASHGLDGAARRAYIAARSTTMGRAGPLARRGEHHVPPAFKPEGSAVELDMEPDTISEKLELMDMKHSDTQVMLMSVRSQLDEIEGRQDIVIGAIGALALGAVAIVAKPHIEKGLSRLRQRQREKHAAV